MTKRIKYLLSILDFIVRKALISSVNPLLGLALPWVIDAAVDVLNKRAANPDSKFSNTMATAFHAERAHILSGLKKHL